MIEVYLFLAVFPVQILAMSVLYPIRFARIMRASLAKMPAARVAELYPGVDVFHAHERFLVRFRAANAVVVVLGLLLLGWFSSHMQQPDWDEGVVGGMLTAYFLLQNVPIVLIAWFTVRFNKVHKRAPAETKRRAILQRRGLFDFVSPIAVVLAALSYFQFAAFMFYVARDPFPGFAGPYVNIGIITLMFAVGACVVYWVLHGRKTDPLQTHEDRMGMMRGVVNAYVWTCILLPMVLSLSIARQRLDVDTWGPFAGSVSFLLLSLVNLRSVSVPPRQPEADGRGSSPAHP